VALLILSSSTKCSGPLAASQRKNAMASSLLIVFLRQDRSCHRVDDVKWSSTGDQRPVKPILDVPTVSLEKEADSETIQILANAFRILPRDAQDLIGG
jgi:hypothetical protein